MSRFVTRDYYFKDLSCHNRQEVFETIADKISDLLSSKEALIQDLSECEKIYVSTPKNNVVLLTGKQSHTENTHISIYKLKKPIQWQDFGTEKTQLIVYWDRGKQMDEAKLFESGYITRILYVLFSDHATVNDLILNDDFDALRRALRLHGDRITLGSKMMR